MENERLIEAGDLWSDIMMLPHNGDMISSEEVEQAIKDAPTVEAVPVWIPVTERLPDRAGMPVLLVAVNIYGQRTIVKGFADYECPVDFLTTEKPFDNCWHMWNVTHWMPLPEPPKMDGGKDDA